MREILRTTADILRGVNANVWGGVKEAEKVGTIVKSGLSLADVAIGTSHALEDAACQDYVCATLDVIGSVSTTVGLVIGNLPGAKSGTTITGAVTVACRTVRYYCKNYGTFWGCTVAIGKGVKEVIRINLKP